MPVDKKKETECNEGGQDSTALACSSTIGNVTNVFDKQRLLQLIQKPHDCIPFAKPRPLSEQKKRWVLVVYSKDMIVAFAHMLCWLLHEFGGLMHIWMIFFLHTFVISPSSSVLSITTSPGSWEIPIGKLRRWRGLPWWCGGVFKKTCGQQNSQGERVSCRGTSPKPLRVFLLLFYFKITKKTLVDGSEVYIPKANVTTSDV